MMYYTALYIPEKKMWIIKIKLSQVVVGNQVLCLDIEEKANFHHLDSIKAKLVMVDCERMISDLG